ncbi:MAG TPA: inositol monophosphatase family protein [Acidimicrobiales bacterium]|nr:inositol monophosphatase family protein [Acidimicrobiales bacterium]
MSVTVSAAETAEAARVADRLARWAMGRIDEHRPTAEERRTKSGPADWVTDSDVAVERHVRHELAAAFPGHAVVGEELGRDEPADDRPRWYLDPIDGTTNFVHGLAGYTFSLSLADGDGLVLGVVANPRSGEVWDAVRGQGARLDGHPISTTAATDLTGGIVLTELAAHQVWPGLAEAMADLSHRHCATRILGSSAVSVVSVAAGRAAGVLFGGNAHPIDVSAGVLIAREAGAVVAGGAGLHPVLGATVTLPRPGMIVAAPGVADELVALLATTGGD